MVTCHKQFSGIEERDTRVAYQGRLNNILFGFPVNMEGSYLSSMS